MCKDCGLCLFSTSSPDDIVGFMEWCGDTIEGVETFLIAEWGCSCCGLSGLVVRISCWLHIKFKMISRLLENENFA
jgi:hypothetical protein